MSPAAALRSGPNTEDDVVLQDLQTCMSISSWTAMLTCYSQHRRAIGHSPRQVLQACAVGWTCTDLYYVESLQALVVCRGKRQGTTMSKILQVLRHTFPQGTYVLTSLHIFSKTSLFGY